MEPNIDPFCDNCLKSSSIKFEQSLGYTGAKLNEEGWLYKNAILFTKKNTPLCFCSKECKDQYYKEILGVTEEQSKDICDWSKKCQEDFKKEIPSILVKMNKLSQILKNKNK